MSIESLKEAERALRVIGDYWDTMVPHSVMQSQIDAAVLAERERCAKLLEGPYASPDIAAKIREGA